MTKIFNYRRLYEDLNIHRKRRGIAWHKVGIRAGVTTSGLSMFVKQFEEPDKHIFKALSVDSLVKLLNWMGKTDLAPYLIDEDDSDVVA
jgi:hypothetical protein